MLDPDACKLPSSKLQLSFCLLTGFKVQKLLVGVSNEESFVLSLATDILPFGVQSFPLPDLSLPRAAAVELSEKSK